MVLTEYADAGELPFDDDAFDAIAWRHLNCNATPPRPV
jgi:hypothetical protein